MELPRARIVRQAGVVVAPPREPLRRRFPTAKVKAKRALARVGRPLRELAGLAIALWPLTATLLLGIIAIWAIGANASVRP